jgi:hypothetical protein
MLIEVDPTRRLAAPIAGCAFLISILIVVVSNYTINFRLSVPDGAVETARNIRLHETLFRTNLVCNLGYAFAVLVVATTLYVTLRPAGEIAALLATICRSIVAVMWTASALKSLESLRLLTNTGYLSLFPDEQRQSLARAALSGGYDAYYIGLPFWGAAAAICSYLLYRSRAIPRGLSAFGFAASSWAVLCGLVFLVVPSFEAIVHPGLFDMPLVLFETTLGVWLIAKGLRLDLRTREQTLRTGGL